MEGKRKCNGLDRSASFLGRSDIFIIRSHDLIDIVERGNMALTALGVARSGAIGYTAIAQIMIARSVPDWFNEISERNQELQIDVMNTYEGMCWCHDCLMDQHFELLLEAHIEENWQKFFGSELMFIPLEGH